MENNHLQSNKVYLFVLPVLVFLFFYEIIPKVIDMFVIKVAYKPFLNAADILLILVINTKYNKRF